MDMRIGLIESLEDVKKSDSLYRMQVYFGEPEDGGLGRRQILAGIKKHWIPAELIGEKCLFVVNLPPRKIMGHLSYGMILCVPAEDGTPLLLNAKETWGELAKLSRAALGKAAQ